VSLSVIWCIWEVDERLMEEAEIRDAVDDIKNLKGKWRGNDCDCASLRQIWNPP